MCDCAVSVFVLCMCICMMYSYIYIHAFIRDPNLGHAFSMTSQTSNRRHWYIHYIYISLASPAAPPVPHALPPTPYYYYISPNADRPHTRTNSVTQSPLGVSTGTPTLAEHMRC